MIAFALGAAKGKTPTSFRVEKQGNNKSKKITGKDFFALNLPLEGAASLRVNTSAIILGGSATRPFHRTFLRC